MEKASTYQPFPGLKAYSLEDSKYFSGRERQKYQLLKIIEERNFVAVVGVNGVGKTSFVNSEIIPELMQGFTSNGRSSWKIVSFRPGKNPLNALATALSQIDVVRSDDSEKIDPNLSEQFAHTLRDSKYGIIEIVEEYKLTETNNLLIYIDHLDDLLLYSNERSQSSKRDLKMFTDRLVEVINQSAYAITIITTLRTQNMGHFSSFQEFADAINKNQFLLSALQPQGLISIFEKISKDGQITFDPELVKHTQHYYKSNPLILGKFQHAMKRSVEQWRTEGSKGSVGLDHLEAVGGINETISYQLDNLYGYMSSSDKKTCKLMFQAITETSTTDNVYSVPRAIEEISTITGQPSDEVVKVVKAFADKNCEVITKYDPQDILGRLKYLDHANEKSDDLITENSDVNISQDFLLEEWPRLNKWVKEEHLNSNVYRDIAKDAERNDPPYEGEKLMVTWKWYEEVQPHAGWAQQYYKNFSLVEDFILKSKNLSDKERARRESEELSREQKLKRNRNIKIFFSLVALVLIIFAFIQTREASEALQEASEQQVIAKTAEEQAKKAKEEAKFEKRTAELSIRQASIESELAQIAQDSAKIAKEKAQIAQIEAQEAQRRARQLRSEANKLTQTVNKKNRELGKAEKNIAESRLKVEYLGILEAVGDYSDEAMKILDRTNTRQQRLEAAKIAAKGYDEFLKVKQAKFNNIKDTTKEVTRKKLFSALILAYQKVGDSRQLAQIDYGVALSEKQSNSQADGSGEVIIGTNDKNSSIFKIEIENGNAEKPVKIATAEKPEERIMGVRDLCFSNSAKHFLVSHLPIDQNNRYISKYDADGNFISSKEVASFIVKIFPYGENNFLTIDQRGNVYLTDASSNTIKNTSVYEADDELMAADFNEKNGQLFLALTNRKVVILNVSNNETTEKDNITFTDFNSEISAIKYIATRDWMLLGTRLGELYLFDATSKKCIYKSLNEHGGHINCLVSDDNEKNLVSGGRDKILNIWNLEELATHISGKNTSGRDYQPIEFNEVESIRDVTFLGDNWILVVFSTEGLSTTGKGGASLLPLDFDVTGKELKNLVE